MSRRARCSPRGKAVGASATASLCPARSTPEASRGTSSPRTGSIARCRLESELRSQTSRRPSSVSHGSTRATVRVCGAIRSASPPVAIACAPAPAPPGCARRSRPPVPRTRRRAPTGARHGPLADHRRRRGVSTRNSLAARANSASIEISTPGASTPPSYSPSADTTSKFVEVPKSTTIAGAP